MLTGTGDVLEPENGLPDRLGRQLRPGRRARADRHEDDAEDIARRAMAIAADICVYTNDKSSSKRSSDRPPTSDTT